ncbi:unnamed protein product [Strongylus vulgaris]|uniref:Uncharacterized protein n=1 Tax=Strongylus vulgaris TaxID=40348 RepID=A0A3P7J2B5_STRVU|nr:unnamed protein product [Strongylus vulgaris]
MNITLSSHIRTVPCFVPEASSSYQKIIGVLRGRRPEFVNANQVARPEARHATRVSTQGKLRVRIDVLLKDIRKFGFQTVPSRGLMSQEPTPTDLSKLRLGREKKPVEEPEMSTPGQSEDKVTDIISPPPPLEDTSSRPLPALED